MKPYNNMKPCHKVLIANRGEIAVRIIRACQEMGIKTVALHSEVDKNSLHTKIASESICIGPGMSLKSYLNIPAVMSAAEISGADAIHPGYGFLAESSEFATICNTYNINFIGPSAQQIQLMGNKINARKIAIEANVPLLPGSTTVIATAKDGQNYADKIGYPIIIKAVAGGGGRGMKVVHERKDFNKLFSLASQEAYSNFKNSACYIEKYLKNPRHIEVQVCGDKYGNYVHLGERDCSLQRRHQKVLEEAPSLALNHNERQQVAKYAMRILAHIGYESMGTIEFLFEDRQFYFMEMNTRIQVEHPVTEAVTGFDLIKEQIKIAYGEKLASYLNSKATGHAIECRINAEDPKNFAPHPGSITAYHEPGGPGVRIDSMAYTGYRIPSLYDSLLAKIITHGRDRQESITRMRRALNEMRIEGIKTTIPFHLELLERPDFINNNLSTKSIDNWYK